MHIINLFVYLFICFFNQYLDKHVQFSCCLFKWRPVYLKQLKEIYIYSNENNEMLKQMQKERIKNNFKN